MSLSIAYHAKMGVGRSWDNNIIEFLDIIYIKLGLSRHFEDSDDFSKKCFATLRIIKSYKSIFM